MLDVDLSNNTLHPNIDQYFGFSTWALVYMHLQNLSSSSLAIFGNSIVLYTSIRYQSLNMCKVSVLLLENLAFADLCFAIIGGLPMYVTLVAKHWVLGKFLCAVSGLIASVFGTAEILILASISLYRAILLKNPFMFRGVSDNKFYLAIAVIWGIACVPSLAKILSGGFVYYDPNMLSCTADLYTNNSLCLVVMLLTVLLAVISIIISNIVMLVVSIRFKRRMNKITTKETGNMSAVLTVMCICSLFVVSWIPYMVRVVCTASDIHIPPWFYIFQVHFLCLNVALNPVIYTLTNNSFKTVLMEKVFGVFRRFAKVISSIRKPSTN